MNRQSCVTDDVELQVGLIADSHDHLPRIRDVIDRLNAESVELVLHAGDYSAPFVTKYYAALKVRMIGVFGNNDAERAKLSEMFAKAGHEVTGRFAEAKAEGCKIALIHGDDDNLLRSLTTCGGYDVVVHGHTHEATVAEHGSTLVINPGEICGYLTGKSTFAILDSASKKARMISF